jgi:hypothetical protein
MFNEGGFPPIADGAALAALKAGAAVPQADMNGSLTRLHVSVPRRRSRIGIVSPQLPRPSRPAAGLKRATKDPIAWTDMRVPSNSALSP